MSRDLIIVCKYCQPYNKQRIGQKEKRHRTNLWRFRFTDAQRLTEICINSIVGFAFTLWWLNPVTNTRYLLFLAVVFTLKLVDTLRIVQSKCTQSTLAKGGQPLIEFFCLSISSRKTRIKDP